MGNSNVHNHKRCPLFFAGKAGGALRGNLHLKAADGTPMANVFLTLMQDLGLDLNTFGDSTGRFELKSVPSTTAAATSVRSIFTASSPREGTATITPGRSRSTARLSSLWK